MKQKVKFFNNEYRYELEKEINDFAEKYHIESISYSACEGGYTTHHYCCVVYQSQ